MRYMDLLRELDGLWDEFMSKYRGMIPELKPKSLDELMRKAADDIWFEKAFLDHASIIKSLPEVKNDPFVRELVYRQIEDEKNHFDLIMSRVKAWGINVDMSKPGEDYTLMLERLKGFNSIIEYAAYTNLVGERFALIEEEIMGLAALEYGDLETAKVYLYHILPDEARHYNIGRFIVAKYAKDENDREAALRSFKLGLDDIVHLHWRGC